MAHFKINLLTPQINTDTQNVLFLETTISEFYKQADLSVNQNSLRDKKYSYCYTFNEKLSLHINGQKELTFSMSQNIWLDNELTLNPFVSQVKNGTQLLLIDQYQNEYFFTVKDIKYTMKESNIIYDYTCEDSFTYQHIRQNNGYTIDNNAESEDFIGAQSIDWWVKNKIKPECHVSYTYLSLDEGLYLSKTTGNLVTFDKYSSLTDVEKVVKPIFLQNNSLTPQFQQYPEYYEAFPFSVSGGNASSSLISLGDEVGLMLNYKEQNVKKEDGSRSNAFVRYFWFEPKKNEHTANLKYSPKTNIQSFNFTQNGAALTTILNVESNSFEDELITLIPEIPPFFSTVFSSPSWNDSVFSEGFFTSMCQDTVYVCEDGQNINNGFTYSLDLKDHYIKDESFYDNDYLYLFIYNKKETQKDGTVVKYLSIPEYYNKIVLFNDQDKNQFSQLFINDTFYSTSSARIDFGQYIYNNEDEEGKFTIYNNTYNCLPKNWLGSNQEGCYIRIKLGFVPTTTPVIKNSKMVLKFYRDATAEELEFAQIADACPWLENRLIDFSYFWNQKIISATEYKELLNILKNELRIVNGKLLYYSNEYYRALQQKTKDLAYLQNILDSLSASFNADIVETYKEKGFIEDPTYFKKAYQTYLSAYGQNSKKTAIINYNELLTEYFNKYFKARQRFLKNIYYFKQYFNQKIEMGGAEDIYTSKKTISFNSLSGSDSGIQIITDPDGKYQIKRYLSFAKQPMFVKINQSFNLYNKENLVPLIKIYKEDKTTLATIVDTINYPTFFTNNINFNNLTRCDNTSGYDSTKNYYRVLYKIAKDGTTSTWDNSFTDTDNKGVWYKYKEDDVYIWYGSSLPDSSWGTTEKPWPESITYSGKELQQDFLEVSYNEIVNDYIYKKLIVETQNRDQLYFYHDTDRMLPTSYWWDDKTIERKLMCFQPRFFGAIVNNYSDINFKSFIQAIYNNEIKTEDEKKEMVSYYKYKFPISDVTYTGPNYVEEEYTWNNKKLSFQPANSKNQSYLKYKQYLIDTVVLEKELNYVIESPFAVSEYVSHSIPMVTQDNEGNYFRRVDQSWSQLENGASLSVWSFLQRDAGNSSSTWANKGVNYADFDGIALQNKHIGYFDSETINYAKTMNSFKEWSLSKTERYNATDEIGDIKITKNATEPGSGWESAPYDEDSSFYIHIKKHNSFKDYFNYYSKIGLTYSSARSIKLDRNKTLKYKDKFFRIMTDNDVIDTTQTYRILTTNNLFKDNKTIMSVVDNVSFSSILYYFITQATQVIDLNDVVSNMTWGEYFNERFTYQNYVFSNSTFNVSFIILREDSYIEEKISYSNDWSGLALISSKRYALYSENKEVFNQQGILQDFSSYADLTEGFYLLSSAAYNNIAESQLQPIFVSPSTTQDLRTQFFKQKEDLSFEKVYTINQIKELNKFFYIATDKHEIDSLSNVWNFNKLKVYYHQEYYEKDKNNNFVLNPNLDKTFVKEGYCDFIFTSTDTTYTASLTDEEERLFTRKCTLNSVDGEIVNNTTNGNFWSLYHNRTDCPILIEQAAIIESELSLYWQQAYSASLYCEYFLPPSWQSRVSGGINYFNDNIIVHDQTVTVNEDGTTTITKGAAKLSNKYLPNVAIYHNGSTNRLPKYTIQYSESTVSDNFTLASTELQNHPSYQQACRELGANMNNMVILNYESSITSDYGKMTYYYVANEANEKSGVRWEEFLPSHSSNTTIFENYSGLYVMTYKILKDYFMNKSSWTYTQLKEEQNLTWNKLYKNFPGVLLEESFSYPQATSSSELYLLAKAAFKDKREPEKNYSIALINAYSTLMIKKDEDVNITKWNQYNGQELKIGEGILIDPDEYYSHLDSIYQSLSQYMFITDISYDLRRDSDIQVTVNTIKYQDKLIQRLVKLIK